MATNDVFIKKNEKKPPSPKKKKKLGGPMSLVKVALYMLRSRKGESKRKSPLPAATNAALTNLVGSVRPLYLQSGIDGTPPSQPSLLTLPSLDRGVAEVVVSPHRFETSPHHSSYAGSSSGRSSSIGGSMSRYASAQSLYDLDTHDEEDENDDEDDEDAYYDGIEGDELIDVKAELFIANFYQQMRLQN